MILGTRCGYLGERAGMRLPAGDLRKYDAI
jgi:hypothetical protein